MLTFQADEVEEAVNWLQISEWKHPRHEFVRFYRRLENSELSVQKAVIDSLLHSDILDARLIAYRLGAALKLELKEPEDGSAWQEWSEYAGGFFWKGNFKRFDAAVSDFIRSGDAVDATMLRSLVRRSASENALPAARYFRTELWSDYFVAAVVEEKFAGQAAPAIEALASDLRSEERTIIANKMAKFPSQDARAFARAFAGPGYELPDYSTRPVLSGKPAGNPTASDLIRSFQSDKAPKTFVKATVLKMLQDTLKVGTTRKLQEGYFIWIIANEID